MNSTDPYAAELRVPVQRTRVEVHTELERRTAILFLPPGRSPEDVFEEDAPFIPVEEDGAIRLYARSAIVSLVVDAADVAPQSLAALGVTYVGRSVAVHLRTGKTIKGAIMTFSPLMRTLDVVNQSAKSLAVHASGKVHYLAKAHVVRVEEVV